MKADVGKAGLFAVAVMLPIALPQYGRVEASDRQPGYQGGPRQSEPAGQPGHVPVRVMKTGGVATLGGTVIPFQEITLTAQIAGRIEYVSGLEGEKFKRGAELIRISDDSLRARQHAALASLESARMAARNAGVQYNRELWSPRSRSISRMPGMGMPALFDQMFTQNFGYMAGYGNPDVQRYSDLYAQGAQLSQSYSRVRQAQFRMDELTAMLRDARSFAPFDGVVAHKLVEVGDTVRPGRRLMVFSNMQHLQVKVDVPSRLMAGIRHEKLTAVRLDDPGRTVVKRRIAQQYPVADAERHTVTVKIDLKKTDPAMPGMYAEVIVPEPAAKQRERIVIPSGAVISGRQRGSLPAVYVWSHERQRKERRYVRLGEQLDAEFVAVLSGLHKDDTLIIEDWR